MGMKVRFLKKIKQVQGATLLETLVAIGIVGLIAAGMAQFFLTSVRIQRTNKHKTAMRYLALDIENKLKTASSIYLSLLDPQNIDLIKCTLGTLDGCTNTLVSYDPGAPNYFALHYRTQNDDSQAITSEDPDAPLIYDTNGILCPEGEPTGDAQCAFQAETFFYASCDPAEGSSTCEYGPALLHVAYRVSQIPGTLSNQQRFQDLPRSIHFYTHQVSNILGSTMTAVCNPGAVVAGYDRRGYSICRCSGRYVDSGMTNRNGPICSDTVDSAHYCPQMNQIFRGLNPDGTANCVDIDDAYECIDLDTSLEDYHADMTQRCPAGYWVQEEKRADCSFWCTMPKHGGTWVACSVDEASDPRSPGGVYDGSVQGDSELGKIECEGWQCPNNLECMLGECYSKLNTSHYTTSTDNGIVTTQTHSSTWMCNSLSDCGSGGGARVCYPNDYEASTSSGTCYLKEADSPYQTSSAPTGVVASGTRAGLICSQRYLRCCRPVGY